MNSSRWLPNSAATLIATDRSFVNSEDEFEATVDEEFLFSTGRFAGFFDGVTHSLEVHIEEIEAITEEVKLLLKGFDGENGEKERDDKEIVVEGTEGRRNETVNEDAIEINSGRFVEERVVENVEAGEEKFEQSGERDEPLQDTKNEEITIEYTNLEENFAKNETGKGKLHKDTWF